MISKSSTFLGPNSFFSGKGITPSLVLFLDANNELSYSGSGEFWNDLSIRNNTGKLDNVTEVIGGVPQTSLSFDGTYSFIYFTQSNGIPVGDQQYTIEVWFNSNSYGPSEIGPLVGWGTIGETNQTNVLRLNSNGLYNYWWGNDLNVTFTGTQSMIVGNWYYAAATYDGVDRKIYLNGELKSTDTPGTANVTDSSTLKIGSFYNGFFNGKIAKVKINDKALNSNRILANFNADKVTYGYVYGSMTFDDTQNSFLYSNSPEYEFGTNDFTIEAFVKISTQTGYDGIVSLSPLSTQIGPRINISNTGCFEFWTSNMGGPYNTFTASTDKWYHLVMSRNSGTVSCFINGDLKNQFYDYTNFTGQDVVVGRYYTDVDDHYINGIISNVRLINGTGLYTTNFTVPDVQLGVTSSTKLLIISQQTTPTADVSGLLQITTASNIGWTSSLPELIVRQGLEFFVDANDIVSNDSYSSTNWLDISGKGRNVTFSGPLFYPFCHPGCAYGLTFQNFQTAETSEVTISYPTGYTIETVVRFTNASDGDGIFEFDGVTNGKYINVQREFNGKIRFEVNMANQLLSNTITTNNLWYHITCVYNSSTQLAKIYINGVEDASGSLISSTTTTAQIRLGIHDNYLDGSLSLVRFYSKPFTPAQVLLNFEYTRANYGI